MIKQKHLGSDHLPEYIQGISDFLSDNGVELFDRANVIDIKKINSNKHEIVYKKSKVENTILSKKSYSSSR